MGAWQGIELQRPAQDTVGWADENEKFHPPTLCWHTKLVALRDDGTHFYIGITLSNDSTAREALLSIESAIASLSTFKDCECKADIPCGMHKKVAEWAGGTNAT